jgi:outer membrane protein TolC
MPIWSSGKQTTIIKQAKLELTKMENNLIHAQKAMSIQYTNALNNLSTKSINFDNAKRSLKIANKIYTRTQVKHKEGLASSFELSQMKNQVLQTQGKYIQSLFNLLNAKAELDKLKKQ